ncbi:hypothetical protein BJ878DRAFT_536451 [Calycina marina]|uniref:Uncharacterized protein n=1 Tax=Calycina marina TaxID=1763456 RepID=A0A9P8CCE5_9HELO|nr:hypothetical protein BJ878DRAFT_536451 [Calycina marina]
MEAQSLSTCNQCGKKFRRKAHLLRHQQQHSGDRPYSCRFCAKTFKRSDVLRDHFSRCESRGTSAIPSSLERGRKRHACNECSRLKVKCDNNVPCRKCQEFGRTCVKSRSAAISSPETPGSTTVAQDMGGSDRNSIGFLLNRPSDADFIREFPKDVTLSPQPHSASSARFSQLVALRNGYEPVGAMSSTSVPPYDEYGQSMGPDIDVFLRNLEFDNFERQTHNYDMRGDNILMMPGPDGLLDPNAMEPRAFEIREKLVYSAQTLHQANMLPKELVDAIGTVTGVNMLKWIKLYFKHWHHHGPIVHEPTFNSCTSAIPLVLALMSLGGMYSADESDIAQLRLLLDIVEHYIYSVPSISDEYDLPDRTYIRPGEGAPLEWQRCQLEELQGAYLICILQYWTGNTIARTRIRQQRFTRVVAIMHHLEMQTAQHSPNYVINDQQSFNYWILKESYIRTATIATMLDNAFGVFNNVSPRFQWAEIDLAFPSDDQFFKIANYEQLIIAQRFPSRKMKIKDAFMSLFTSAQSADYNLRVLKEGHLTALDLQMLIHFLYTHIWGSLYNNPLLHLPQQSLSTVVSPFKIAMLNWKTIWDDTRSRFPESEWNKLGFQRTAETCYDTVMMLVNVWERKGGRFPPMPSDCAKGDHLKRLLSY